MPIVPNEIGAAIGDARVNPFDVEAIWDLQRVPAGGDGRVQPRHVGHGAWILDDIVHAAQKEEAKAVPKYQIFWGGADVDPSLYDRERSNACGASHIDKDKREAQEMKDLIAQGVPIIGICRGAQLLNVVNGGILVQHIDGHAIGREHLCTEVETGKVFSVSSTHHQMMVAHEDGKVLFKDYTDTNGVHWDNVNERYLYKHVTEVVYYPKTKSLCIQPHPEWMNQESKFVKWINKFIKQEWNLDPINFAAEEAALFRR